MRFLLCRLTSYGKSAGKSIEEFLGDLNIRKKPSLSVTSFYVLLAQPQTEVLVCSLPPGFLSGGS